MFGAQNRDTSVKMTNQQVVDAYAKAMGYTSGKAKTFSDKATYYDENGQEIATIANETARQFLAQ
jgi:hypothetical protein